MLGYSLIVVGILATLAFWVGLGQTVDLDKPRGALAQGCVVLMSWPARFLGYRSGHGRHAV